MRAPTEEAHVKHNTLARLIPDDTPAARLRQLQSRYRSTTDPVVAATPADYRHALLDRLTDLLAGLPVMEPAQ
jgi:hypothetical protein